MGTVKNGEREPERKKSKSNPDENFITFTLWMVFGVLNSSAFIEYSRYAELRVRVWFNLEKCSGLAANKY